jgi:hypothetical protein
MSDLTREQIESMECRAGLISGVISRHDIRQACRQLLTAMELLKQHHDFRQSLGTVHVHYDAQSGTGFGTGGHREWTPINMTDVYQASDLCKATEAALTTKDTP